VIDIQKINPVHHQAMEYAGLARLAEHQGEEEKAKQLYRQAYDY
jgi:hypothetical protein